MRFIAAYACLSIALRAGARAAGFEPSLLGDEFVWVEWIGAAIWLFFAIRMLSWRGE